MHRPAAPPSRGALLLLFGAAFLLRALFAVEAGKGLLLSVPVGDEQVFLDWGMRVAGGQVAGEGTLWQAPGAAWLLGGWYSLVGPGLLAAAERGLAHARAKHDGDLQARGGQRVGAPARSQAVEVRVGRRVVRLADVARQRGDRGEAHKRC